MVRSSHPAAVLEKISALVSLGNYRLMPIETESMRDVYFDTPDHSLSSRRLNLRLRYLTNVVRVTLKQSPGLFTRNRNERRETELDWSFASLSKILQEISGRGIRLESTGPGESDPADAMKKLGLIVIQDRETNRRPREVVSVRGEILAEVAIDSVTYHIDRVNVMLDEVEIEAKSKNGKQVVDQVAKSLTLVFGSELQRWRSGKLSTGMKIERLLRNGRLNGLIQEGRLKQDAYDLLLGDQACGHLKDLLQNFPI
jgi:adenylate cyclase class IV